MEWKYVKPLSSEDDINEFECLVKYAFPEAFRECMKKYNGGRPEKKIFETDASQERALKSFLSFNKNDRETVWKVYEWNKQELADRYVAFAVDNFGNLICFDANNDNIVFLNHEDLGVEKVADNFMDFMKKLHR